MGIAVAQTATPWHLHNRYIELSAGQHQQNYREQDTGGLTADGTLDTETGHQDHIGAALRWQTENGWIAQLEVQRQSGATSYNGYKQASNGQLTPYRARSGNTATQQSVQIGYALNSSTWQAMPASWQVTPLLQLSSNRWQRNLVQYSEIYRHTTYAGGARVQWQIKAGTLLEAQALLGRTEPATVNVPALGFAATQASGSYQQWHLGISQDLGVATGKAVLNGWAIAARYERSRYSHSASPVANGLQAPPNQHQPRTWTLGLQKQF